MYFCVHVCVLDSSMGRQVRNREETKNYLDSVNRYNNSRLYTIHSSFATPPIARRNRGQCYFLTPRSFFLLLFFLKRIIELTMERSLRPWLDNDLLFNLTALGRENRKCVNVLHNFTNKVLNVINDNYSFEWYWLKMNNNLTGDSRQKKGNQQ